MSDVTELMTFHVKRNDCSQRVRSPSFSNQYHIWIDLKVSETLTLIQLNLVKATRLSKDKEVKRLIADKPPLTS